MESFVVCLNASFPVSAKLAMLSTQKASEFRKHRYSQRFKDLRKLAKVEKKRILQRKINEAVAEAEGSNSWLSRLEFLLDPDGCTRGETKILPEHLDLGLSHAQQTEDYASHISAISREYVPLAGTKLPDQVRHALDHALFSGHPGLADQKVHKILCDW